jgi:carbamoyltransferase
MVQAYLEKAVITILNAAYEKYGKSKLALAGGVALNCKMNEKISTLPWVNEMFIQPGSNDSGLCVGAAYLGVIEMKEPIAKMTTAYLGPDIEDTKIEEYIRKNRLRGEYLNNPEEKGAELLAQGNLIAWMQGRMEFGPRALGHRSLLGDPRSNATRDKLNMIKNREPWRPVAPAIIESAERYCDINQATEFMTKAIPMNELALREIPGALHVDNTARVQLVKDREDVFYKLISSFEKITGIPAVLNTSLNTQGEPICTTLDDGIKFFFTTPTDYLIIGKWLIRK